MIEWLRRSADDIYNLRRKPRLSTDKCLEAIRQSYDIIYVLTLVVEKKAYMLGISPPNDT